MPITINGDSGLSGVNGDAGTPALQGTDSNTGIVFGTDTVQVSTGGTTRATVDSSGNVGIGLSNPSQKLTVDCGAPGGADKIITQFQAESSRQLYIGWDDSQSTMAIGTNGSHAIAFHTNGQNAEKIRLDTSGRLLAGTGTASSAGQAQYSLLEVSGNTGSSTGSSHISIKKGEAASAMSDNDTLGRLIFTGLTGGDFAYIQASVDGSPSGSDFPARLMFFTCADGASSATERMRINSSGTMRYGQSTTDSPGSGNTTTGLSMRSDGRLFMSMGATFSQFNRNSDGSVINFTRSASSVGSIAVNSSATAYNTSSDYRLKENVVDIADGITRVKQLSPKRFNFIVDADTTVDGFLAHEAQTVVPEAVTGQKDATREEEYEVTPAVEEVVDEDGNITTAAVDAVMGTRTVPDHQGIDQSKLVPLLTAALQETIAKIETLETQNASLEARLTALEGGAS